MVLVASASEEGEVPYQWALSTISIIPEVDTLPYTLSSLLRSQDPHSLMLGKVLSMHPMPSLLWPPTPLSGALPPSLWLPPVHPNFPQLLSPSLQQQEDLHTETIPCSLLYLLFWLEKKNTLLSGINWLSAPTSPSVCL